MNQQNGEVGFVKSSDASGSAETMIGVTANAAAVAGNMKY